MKPEQIRDAISETFRGKDGARVLFTLLAMLHAITNVFSERLRPLFPFEVPFFVLDRNPYKFKWKRKPFWYFLAKVVTLFVLLFALAALGEVSRAILAL